VCELSRASHAATEPITLEYRSHLEVSVAASKRGAGVTTPYDTGTQWRGVASSVEDGMNESERGKLIIAAAKTLKQFQSGDINISAFLHATFFAGRAGLFASAIRSPKLLDSSRLRLLAAGEALSPHDLTGTLIPWLEKSGLAVAYRSDGKVQSIQSAVLEYDSILEATAQLHSSLDPSPEDEGCLIALGQACRLPTPESEVLQLVAKTVGEESANTALSLAKSYRIVSYREGKGLAEPLLFSERLWGRAIGNAAKALSNLDLTDREVLLHFVELVHSNQGLPESYLRAEAEKHNAPGLVDLAIGVGLLNQTDLEMADGTPRSFLTSPHFYQDLADAHGEDMCDRVKIFLDSIRNGQYFGDPWTGRIVAPEVLLSRLINRGSIGPCSAIGTDYITSEKAGIVRTRRVATGSSRYTMELMQRDTVETVLELITTGEVHMPAQSMAAEDIREGVRFRSIEQKRAVMGKTPARVAEAERAVILALREG